MGRSRRQRRTPRHGDTLAHVDLGRHEPLRRITLGVGNTLRCTCRDPRDELGLCDHLRAVVEKMTGRQSERRRTMWGNTNDLPKPRIKIRTGMREYLEAGCTLALLNISRE